LLSEHRVLVVSDVVVEVQGEVEEREGERGATNETSCEAHFYFGFVWCGELKWWMCVSED